MSISYAVFCLKKKNTCLPFSFFFKDTATTEIYTLSLHDALPISAATRQTPPMTACSPKRFVRSSRSEEHTSELQSHVNLVCRLLLEKKKHMPAIFFFF